MSERIQFTIPLEAVPKGRPRFGRGMVRTPYATRRFERDFAMAASFWRPREPWLGPLDLTLVFFLPKPKSCPKKRIFPEVMPDIDNFVKAAMDAMKAFWKDDAQVVKLTSGKYYSTDGKPAILVRLDRMADRDGAFTWLR